MRDTEAVASIVAGDPDGLAAAYDRYADPLFTYCRTLLGDDAGAADAVQDTFVIAAARLSGLDDPRRLRAWLFAVARAECSRAPRRPSSGTPAAARQPDPMALSALGPPVAEPGGHGGSPPEMTAAARRPDTMAVSAIGPPREDLGGHGGSSPREMTAGLRTLFEDAAAGLGPGEREIIGLHLRQGLDPDEVAIVLGVSRSRARTLLSRAGEQLETCLGALLVGRAGRDECAELGSMLTGWDGRLAVPLRKRVHRHIEHCATCSARRAFELRPGMLLEMAPAAALAAGAAESLRLATGAPEGLRAHTIALATEHGSSSAAHAMAVLSRAGTFGSHGFPRAAHRGAGGGAVPRSGLRSSPQGQAAVAAAVVLAVGAAAAGFALTGGQGQAAPVADPRPPASSARAATSTTTGATTVPATTRTAPSRSATSRRSPTALATTPAPPVVPQATVPAPGTPSSSPSPAPHATTSPPVTPSASQAAGTLRVFPGGGSLFLVPGGRGALLFLSASGGTVDWSVSVSGDPGNTIRVSPAMSGTLTAAHPHVVLSITASANLSCGQRHGGSACPTITIEPGGTVFTITSGRGHPFRRGRRHRD